MRSPVVLLAAAALPGILLAAAAANAAPASREAPDHYCARVNTDDTLRTPPRSLGPAINRLFKISGRYALETSYYRCADGNVLLCTVGANLPCGKANTSRALPGVSQWCATHENDSVIPMAVTGHDTLYEWRCVGRTAKAGKPVGARDARGFFAEYWKRLK